MAPREKNRVVPAEAGSTIHARTIVKGLDHPAAFDVAPGGDIFYGERVTGEIRVWVRERDRTRPFLQIPDVAGSVTTGTGLLAVTLDPGYPDVPYVYALATEPKTLSKKQEQNRSELRKLAAAAVKTIPTQ